MIRFFMIIAFAITTVNSFAQQQKPRKFGAITKQELEMKSYPNDTTAKAVVLYEFGTSSVRIVDDKFIVIFKYHKIIKFFDDDELDRANISLQYSRNATITKFKAASYNLVDGEIIERNITKKDIHTEKLVDNVQEQKFSFADVRPGSIIEYTYQKKSGSIFFLNAWSFQSTIPIAWSEYIVSAPLYLNYKTISSGYTPLYIANVTEVNMSLDHEVIKGKRYRYVVKNAPAFVSEKYMTAKSNFITTIEFELQSIQTPSYHKEYFSSFNQIQELLMEDEDFGLRIKKIGFAKEVIAKLKSDSENQLDLAKNIYKYVHDNTTWNKYYSMYASKNFKTLAEEDANSGMINLFMVALLKGAGLEANPVILSTRANGTVHPVYPLLKSYNYVIAHVKIDGVTYLLDGTDDFLPFNVLPERCLNGKGRLIGEYTNYWINLLSAGERKMSCGGSFTIDEYGDLEGSLSYKYNGYRGYELKEEVSTTGKDELLEEYAEKDGWEIDASSMEGENDINSPLKIKIDLAISDKVDMAGERIYITPLVVGQTKNNPFKLENRQYPVDFTCPRKSTFMISYKIPEGYEVEYLPKPLIIALPNKGGKYLYMINEQNGIITTTVQYKLNQTVFGATEYPILKEYFAQIVNKEAEQIVLKEKL